MATSYIKIKNISANPVKFVIPLASSGSKGVLLSSGECIIAEAFYTKGALLVTSNLSLQKRRGLIEIQESFNNDLYKFAINQNLSITATEQAMSLADAQRNAENYMKS